MNDFENIRPPTTLVEQEPLLCCDESTTKPRRQVRLFYADGCMSNVLEVDPALLGEATRSYCVLPKGEAFVYYIPGSHHFFKVKDLQGLEVTLRFEKVQRLPQNLR